MPTSAAASSGNPSSRDPFNTLRPTVHELQGWRLLLFWPMAALLHLWFRSWRVRMDAASRAELLKAPSPRLILTWHNRSLLMPESLRCLFAPERVHCLISPSKAAAWEVALFRTYRLNAIRGSSSRRGVHAMREMLRALKRGDDVAISPDGPSGPVFCVQPGAVRLARIAKVPLALCSSKASWALRLKTWDRHLIPLPFSRIDFRVEAIAPDDPLWELDDSEVAKRLASRLLD